MNSVPWIELSRREVLASGASGVVGGMLMMERAHGEESKAASEVYRALGIKPIINAAGTITALGGSIMPPEVLAAWKKVKK